MVKKLLLIIMFLLISTNAHSAYWIKYDIATTFNPRCVTGDGVKVGAVTSYATYGIPLSGWLRSNITECPDANQSNVKVDSGIIVGSRIVPMTQTEIDAVALAKQQAATLSLHNSAKGEFNNTHLKAFIKILLNEINILRSQHSLSNRTMLQLRNAINAEIDSGNSD